MDLRNQNINVKCLRCDDAVENKALEDLFRDKGMGIKFEYSGPRTPQRNGKVEKEFQTAKPVDVSGAGLQDKIRHGIWAECTSTATFHSNIMVTKDSMMSPFEICFGKKAHCVDKLIRIFGEMGVVTTEN